MTTGAVHGQGIYISPVFTTAAGYAKAFYGGGKGQTVKNQAVNTEAAIAVNVVPSMFKVVAQGDPFEREYAE